MKVSLFRYRRVARGESAKEFEVLKCQCPNHRKRPGLLRDPRSARQLWTRTRKFYLRGRLSAAKEASALPQ